MAYSDIDTLRNDINRDIQSNTTRSITGEMVRTYLFGLCDVVDTNLQPYYGIKWKFNANGTSDVIRVGNIYMHQALPIQSGMKGCLVNIDGLPNYYLNPFNWNKKEDYTDSVLTGADGDVMVEVPEFWYNYTSETIGDVTWYTLLLSEYNLNGYVIYDNTRIWTKSPKFYVGAYKAQIDSVGKLQSIAGTYAANAGHNNYGNTGATGLGNFRAYARAKTGSLNWVPITYAMRKAIWMLFITEYGTLNSQETFNSALTVEGYHQGGLGLGVTQSPASNNIGNYAQVRTGYTNEYGNFSVGSIYLTNSDKYNNEGLSTSNYKCRYRGIENPFGEVWEWTDGVFVENYVAYEVLDKANFSKIGSSSYSGDKSSECRVIGNVSQTSSGYSIKTILGGSHCDILASDVNTSDSGGATYYRDGWWASTGFRGVLFGGGAVSGAPAGLVCAAVYAAPSAAAANVGSRLAYIVE